MDTFFRQYIVISLTCCCFSSLAQYNYPVVRTEPFDTIIYGKKINDPYFWMSRKANEKELLELTKAQVSLTRNILDSITGTEILLKEWEEDYSAFDDELWDLKAVGNIIYYNRYLPGEGTWL